MREVLVKANHISNDEASFEEEINLDYLDEVRRDKPGLPG